MAQHFHSLCFHQQVLLKLQTKHGGRHRGVTGGSSKAGMANRVCFIPKYGPSAVHPITTGRAFPGGTRLPGAPGSGRALPALGVGFGPSHTRSRTGVQPSFGRVQTQQHWTFHDKDNSSPGETYFSMYFSWTLWLLTRTKSGCCSITEDCLVSNWIKCHFYCFRCFPPQQWKEQGGEDDMIPKLWIPP